MAANAVGWTVILYGLGKLRWPFRPLTAMPARLVSLLAEVAGNREVVIIRRRGGDDVVMIAADGLARMMQTLHVLDDSANTERLLTALARAREGGGGP